MCPRGCPGAGEGRTVPAPVAAAGYRAATSTSTTLTLSAEAVVVDGAAAGCCSGPVVTWVSAAGAVVAEPLPALAHTEAVAAASKGAGHTAPAVVVAVVAVGRTALLLGVARMDSRIADRRTGSGTGKPAAVRRRGSGVGSPEAGSTGERAPHCAFPMPTQTRGLACSAACPARLLATSARAGQNSLQR